MSNGFYKSLIILFLKKRILEFYKSLLGRHEAAKLLDAGRETHFFSAKIS